MGDKKKVARNGIYFPYVYAFKLTFLATFYFYHLSFIYDYTTIITIVWGQNNGLFTVCLQFVYSLFTVCLQFVFTVWVWFV